jgi:hypothetical protein
MKPTRSHCFTACIHSVKEKKAVLHSELTALAEGVESESKSTAGDKHETGRAMLNIEQDRLARQLTALDEQEAALQRLQQTGGGPLIAPGSLIETDRGWFFLCIALGRITVNGVSVMTLSPESPLGAQWLGLAAGASSTFNGINYAVVSVE